MCRLSFNTSLPLARAGALLALSLLAGCSAAPVDAGFAQVDAAVAERTGHSVHWREDAISREAATARLLLASPLGIDDAVRIALLNDHALQARFEDLGIAAAELQQAGIVGNPTLGASLGFSNLAGTVPSIGLDLMASIGELLTRAPRQRIAGTQLQAVQMELASLVIARIAEVQRAYYQLLGARQIAQLRRQIDEAADARHALAERYFAAGNISDLDLARETGDRELAAVERIRAEGGEAVAAAHLQRALGLADRPIGWQLPDQLPALPGTEPPLAALVAQASRERPDVIAARQRLDAQSQTLALARQWRYLGTIEGGVGGVRETDRERVIGPRLQLGLPLFDRRQAAIAREDAQRRQAEESLLALTQQLHAEVQEQLLTLDVRRRTAQRYLASVIPAHQRIVEVGQRYNNYMLLSVFELLAARQAEYAVYQGYLEAVRDYWLARVDLQQSLGGRAVDGPLPGGLVTLPAVPAEPSAVAAPGPTAPVLPRSPADQEVPPGQGHDHH